MAPIVFSPRAAPDFRLGPTSQPVPTRPAIISLLLFGAEPGPHALADAIENAAQATLRRAALNRVEHAGAASIPDGDQNDPCQHKPDAEPV